LTYVCLSDPDHPIHAISDSRPNVMSHIKSDATTALRNRILRFLRRMTQHARGSPQLGLVFPKSESRSDYSITKGPAKPKQVAR